MSETISHIPARSLREVCEDARRATCPVCPVLSGDECVFTTVPVAAPIAPGTRMRPARGYHVGRLAVAETVGLISAADFDVAVVTAGAFDIRTVIYDTDGTAMSSPGPHPITITIGQARTILNALADAGAFHRERGGQHCADCNEHPAGLCEDHAGDLDAADEYQHLAAELGGQR
jgi:hypothetical protein